MLKANKIVEDLCRKRNNIEFIGETVNTERNQMIYIVVIRIIVHGLY